MILHDEELMGRVFTHNHKVELMHIALNGLKICHPLPLQDAVTITFPVERTVCLQMFSGSPPVYQGTQHVSSRGCNFTIVPENAVACRPALGDYAWPTSCRPGKRMA